jgi:V8-like Glu-specific endopeptidase
MEHELKSRAIRTLAELYPDITSVDRLLGSAGIPIGNVGRTDRPLDLWHNVITETDHRSQTSDLLKVAVLDYPRNPTLHEWLGTLLDSSGGFSSVANDGSNNVEKIMGSQSTLLPISFLQMGLERARSVGRITTQRGHGSGFVVGNDFIVTNYHVIGSADEAERAEIGFDYETDARGNLRSEKIVQLRPERGFATSVADDLTIIRADAGVSSKWGCIPIDDVDTKHLQRVNIIQHPGGGPKQVALYHNVVSHVDDRRIQYYTDTLPGSSGSPLFDDRWALVGVHHSGGRLYSPGAKEFIYTNEGIPVGRLKALIGTLEE